MHQDLVAVLTVDLNMYNFGIETAFIIHKLMMPVFGLLLSSVQNLIFSSYQFAA